MNIVKALVIPLALSLCTSAAAAQQELRILIDVGVGGAILRGAYSREAARLAGQEIARLDLAFGDDVVIATFGDPNASDHLDMVSHNRRTTLTYSGPHAATLPAFVGQLIAEMPGLPMHRTSDLDARITMYPPSCTSHTVTTIVMSNGYEIGERDGRAFRFPEMSTPGCGEIVFIGFGIHDDAPVEGLLPLAEGLVRSIMMEAGYDAARFLR